MELKEKNAKIFLICGKARHGKTTMGNIIKEYAEKKSMKSANTLIALYLKTYAKQFFGWDGKESTKPRELLQQLGTDIIREKLNKPTFFIDRTIEDIEILSHFFDVIIIDDIRFPMEIESIKNKYKDTIVVKVVRTDFESELTKEQEKHKTETALDDYPDENYDYTINNDKDLDSYKNKIIKMLEEVL